MGIVDGTETARRGKGNMYHPPRQAWLAGRAIPSFSARPSFKKAIMSSVGGVRRRRAPPRLTAPNWCIRCAALPAPKVSSEMLSIGLQGGAQKVFEETPRTGSRAAPKTASRGCAAHATHRPNLAQSAPSQSFHRGDIARPLGACGSLELPAIRSFEVGG